MKVIHFLGSRIIKTGVAVLLTALICYWLNWPPVFAVITAIVTLEPTVSDSIKKGIVRFPASVIGSGYAVLLIALFGNSPITYTLAAVLTIATCFKLRLHAGLLVATLTAVTMVEVVQGDYVLAFLTRLGTTSIGLLVSTGVNMFVLPADYREDIAENIRGIRKQTGMTLRKMFMSILDPSSKDDESINSMIAQLKQQIRKTEMLIRFQNDESAYHPLVGKEKRQFLKAEGQLTWLRMLHYHLDNLNRMSLHHVTWTSLDRDVIILAVKELARGLEDPAIYNDEKHQHQLKRITELFWEDSEGILKSNHIHPTTFPPDLIILYELVSMYNLVDRYYDEENKHATPKKK